MIRNRQIGLKRQSVSIYYQSVSSNVNISFTFFSNTAAIFKDKTVEGIYFPNSIALIVCRLTFTASANCCCVSRLIALSTRIVLFIIHPPEFIQFPVIFTDK